MPLATPAHHSAALVVRWIVAIFILIIYAPRAAADDDQQPRPPGFSYRAGKGLSLTGADDLWSVGFSLETRLDIPFEAGRKVAGRITGEPFDRRLRPFLNVCIFHCVYEHELEADVDEFRSDESHPKRLFVLTLQRSVGYFHLENLLPPLPTLYFGFGYTFEINPYRRGDFTASAQLEYDLLSRNNGFNEGRYVNTAGLRWREISLNPLGVPGSARIDFISGRLGTPGAGIAGAESIRHIFQANLKEFSHWKDYSVVAQIEPLKNLENKWLKGLGISFGAWFCNVEPRLFDSLNDGPCDRLTALDHGPGGRQVLFSTSPLGRGLAYYLTPGFGWRVGPYELRVIGGFQRFSENKDSPNAGLTHGNNFLIANQLFLWSPKGFFTGSADEAGSVLFGMHFERNDFDCNSGGGKQFGSVGCGVSVTQTFGSPPFTVAGAPGFNRNTIILREWDLWYFITTRMSVGVSWLWYRATNLPLAAQYNLGIRSKASLVAHPNQGRGGDWLDVNLAWRWRF